MASNLFRTAVLLLVLAACIPAQFVGQVVTPPTTAGTGMIVVTLQANPEPLVIAANIQERSIGKWDMSACSAQGAPAIHVPIERIRMAFPKLHLITAGNAQMVIQYKASKNWKQYTASVLGEASLAMIPVGASGLFHLSLKGASLFAGGHDLMDYLQGRLANASPNVAPLLSDLIITGLDLKAGGDCETGGVFAGLMHDPQPIQATWQVQ